MTEIAAIEHFPLPLAPFEWYMLEDDCPDYPMTFVFRLRFSGQIDRDAFESAVEDARRRHPLLCARIKRCSRRNPCWEYAEEISPFLDWDAEGVPLRCPAGEFMDLTSEVGLRIWVRAGDRAADVSLQFHHTCCDGLGALQFLGDLLAAYGIRTTSGDTKPELLPIDASRLLMRGEFPQKRPSVMGRVRHLGARLREAYHWCSRGVAPLNLPEESPEPVNSAEGLFEGICTHTFDKNESQSLLAAARSQGVTLNDLLLCNMFLTIKDWNDHHGSARRRKWLRVALPTNLRTAEDQAMPAANRVSMSFLTRRTSECLDAEALLASIQRETEHIKRTRRGLHLLKALKTVRAVWGGLPKRFTHKRCLATAVLSNMGDVGSQFASRLPHSDGRVVVGDLVLEEIIGAIPPLRSQTRAVLLAATYAGRTTLTTRCDPHAFTAAQTQEFLSLYVDNLRRTLASAWR